MKVRRKILSERRIPQGDDFKNLPTLYKVVQDHKTYINGFDRKMADGYTSNSSIAYGQGVYTMCELSDAMNLVGSYGGTIIKAKLLGGFKNFLFFDRSDARIAKLCAQVYGRPMSIYEQLMVITKGDSETASKYNTERASTFGEYHQDDVRSAGYNVRGMVCHYWGGEMMALPFNYGDVVSYAAAQGVSRYDTEETIKTKFRPFLDANARAAQEEYFDMVPQIQMAGGHSPQYERETKRSGTVTCRKINGDFYAPFISKNGANYNMIKFNDSDPVEGRAEFIIPTDVRLDEPLSLPSSQGNFVMIINKDEYNVSLFPVIKGQRYDQPAFKAPYINQWFFMPKLKEVVKLMPKIKEKFGVLREAITPGMTYDQFVAGNSTIVYSCTHKEFVDSIFEHGFHRAYAADNDKNFCGKNLFYGNGVYGSVELGDDLTPGYVPNEDMGGAGAIYLSRYRDSGKSDGLKYGNAILKCVLVGGWNRFLIFDERLAKIVHKSNWRIEDQIRSLATNPAAADTLINEFTSWKRRNPNSRIYNIDAGDSRTTSFLHYLFKSGDSQFAQWEEYMRKNGINGAVYHGGNDGYAWVSWNYTNVIPIEVSFNEGKSWIKKGDFEKAKERYLYDNDPVHRFGHMYKGINKFTTIVRIDGEVFPLNQVQTRDGKYNVLNNMTGKLVLPVNCDAQPALSRNGNIMFEYGGVDFNGTVFDKLANGPAITHELMLKGKPITRKFPLTKDILDQIVKIEKATKR